jgi:hypothetical protein
MSTTTRNAVRNAVKLAMHYWPNSHLGDYSPREDMRSAFLMIRTRLERGESIQSAISDVETSAYRHADM